MAKLKLYTRGVMEDGTVTVSGTPDTGNPASRLYDRDISLYWKETGAVSQIFKVDQGATGNESIDFLAIERHNFDGETLTWQWSDNDSDWNDAVPSWVQSGNAQIIKTLETALTHRYWRVTLTQMVDPQCSEIFMSYGYEFQVDWNRAPKGVKRANVEWRETVGGTERSTKHGDRKRFRSYSLFVDETNYGLFQDAIDDLDELSKPFYIKDHRADYYLCRLTEEPDDSFVNEGLTSMGLDILEQL